MREPAPVQQPGLALVQQPGLALVPEPVPAQALVPVDLREPPAWARWPEPVRPHPQLAHQREASAP